MKQILYIGNKLAQSGNTVTSIETLGKFLSEEGYEVITSSSKKNKVLRILDMLFSVIKNRNKVSYVLIDTYSTQNFYYAVLVGSLCRVLDLSYIPILRGGDLPSRLRNNKRLSQNLFKGAITCVAPSAYLLECFKEYGYTNLTYIPNTLDIKNYTYLQRPQLAPKLLWVRSFSDIYNPLLALEVLEMLIKKGLNATLCMVGPDKDGSLARCKKVASELKLPVTFTGILSKEEWVTLSRDYDIFINTTNFDNMPVSVMEAMALGLPVISTNVGGMPYMIQEGENGILVPPNDAEAFVEAILHLLSNNDKAITISRNARREIEKLDWKIVNNLWKELLC